MTLTVLSLFAGIGGIDLGLELVGRAIIAADAALRGEAASEVVA